MLPQHIPNFESKVVGTWEELGMGAPTIIAMALLCSNAMARDNLPKVDLSELMDEAKALLYLARNRGVFEIKGTNNAYDASARFLSISVEVGEEHAVDLKLKGNPKATIRFLSGFRELCATGLVMHHLFRDFSLSQAGFLAAETISEAEVKKVLQPFEHDIAHRPPDPHSMKEG